MSLSSLLGDAFDLLAAARHDDPFSVLGPHVEPGDEGDVLVIRTVQVRATRVDIVLVDSREPVRMERVHPAGIFEGRLPGAGRAVRYRLRVWHADGSSVEIEDPYRFPPVVGDVDLHLLGEGTHLRLWEQLGARTARMDDVDGVAFVVWAPNAHRVSVVGDWNGWDGRMHPMRVRRPTGVWEIFVPGILPGAHYKYELRTHPYGTVVLKADPCARYAEVPPATASIVWDTTYEWRDDGWRLARAGAGTWTDRPMAVYEVHLGSWRRHADGRSYSYRDLANELVPYAVDMGFTHLELMPVLEHPYTGSWGYQVTGFYATTSRLGTPDDFKFFVDECHRRGLGVILDWVPGHFPRDAHALARFDGTALYEHADPRQGEHQDWGTLIFNYGRNEVRNFLLANALFWLEEFHIDGLRVDAVASMLYLDYSRKEGQWVPNRFGGRENLEAVAFLRQLNELTHGIHPGTITVAEESTAWPAVSRPVYVGGLGFSFKWNMGWMHDILEYVKKDPIHRRWAHNLITFSLMYAWSENFVLPFSHDEVVHLKGSMLAKMPGDAWQKAATLRALYGYMYAHPGKKLLFMGSELADWREWHELSQLPWDEAEAFPHAGMRRFVRDLNAVYAAERALHEVDFEPAGFQWIDCNDNENSVVSLVRRGRAASDWLIAIVSFTPVPRPGYRIGVPEAGRYDELLNSDAAAYGGSNMGNMGSVETEPVPEHGYAQSLSLILPPLSVIFLKKAAEDVGEPAEH